MILGRTLTSWGNKVMALGSLAKGTKDMFDNLLVTVREKIGPIATPDYIQNAPGLPKTRSGKFGILQGLGRAKAQWWQECGWKKSLKERGSVNIVTK